MSYLSFTCIYPPNSNIMPGRDGVRVLAPTFTVMGKHISWVLTSTNPEMPKMGDLGCSWYCRWVNEAWCLRLLLCLWISQSIDTNKNLYTFTVIYTIWNVNSDNWFKISRLILWKIYVFCVDYIAGNDMIYFMWATLLT